MVYFYGRDELGVGAAVAQFVEHLLLKPKVASSNCVRDAIFFVVDGLAKQPIFED